MEKLPIDVINVSGLLMTGENDGIENALRENGKVRSIATIAPMPPESTRDHLEDAISRAVYKVRSIINKIEAQYESSNVALVGRSFGALVALMAAVRMDFEKIAKTVLCEGPLNPDVEVKPPLLIRPLMACDRYYDERPDAANEATDYLKESGTQRNIIIQGSALDKVIPTEAQVIPAVFRKTSPSEGYFDASDLGLIVKLPSDIGFQTTGVRKVLPDSYKNHLFWSDAKMKVVTDVIENA